MDTVTSTLFVNFVCRIGADGHGECEVPIDRDYLVEGLSAIVPGDIAYEDLLQLTRAMCKLSQGDEIRLHCAYGLIPTPSPFQNKMPQHTLNPETDAEWPDWLGMQLLPPWKFHKGTVLTFQIEGPAGLSAGITLYGRLEYSA